MKAILSIIFSDVKAFEKSHTFVLYPLNPRYQDMEVKKGEFQVIGRVVKRY